ncbi:hypothetical protein PLICRDRAFT_41563 [Plicaturopsis crispa FD-325 SS-3]|nr:hypothetical protein PLICRDRAFT_41563 [Plicaturopsis crispa FD-325 SS-3]
MFPEFKVSPSKGKAKEESKWQADWYDFYPLVEQPQRPVVWTRSSTILTAHPSQPLINARIFPLGTQFHIPSPAPVATSPLSYLPPTIISVASTDDWLFAYYPGVEGDGAGCLWKRDPPVDRWTVKEWWSFARGSGVVAVEWLIPEREWTTSPSGGPVRRPRRGPATPISSPTLLLVTQTQQINVCYVRAFIPTLKVLACPLTQRTIVLENQTHANHDSPSGTGGVKVCVRAAIGVGYEESTILVAMRSRLVPSSFGPSSSFDGMDLGIPMDTMTQTSSDSSDPIASSSTEWESWGEESVIELCEVRLNFDGDSMSLATNPLPSIRHNAADMSDLAFICTPPLQTPAPADPSTSPTLSAKKSPKVSPKKSPIVSPKKSPAMSPRKTKADEATYAETARGQFYLASTFLDFGDYSAPPRSQLVLHSFSRNTASSNHGQSKWSTHLEASRSWTSGVLAFCSPCIPSSNHQPYGLYTYVLDTAGTLPRKGQKAKDVTIGSITVLKLEDLEDDTRWEPSTVKSFMHDTGVDLPLSAAISPHNMFLCTASSSMLVAQTSVHALPQYWSENSSQTVSGRFTPSIVSAIRARHSLADISHALSLPSLPLEVMSDILDEIHSILGGIYNGMPHVWTWELMGLTLDVYRRRSLGAPAGPRRDWFDARWRTAHALCTVMSINSGFEHCIDGDGYDLEAIWQLVGLSTWVVDFVERLLKECVSVQDSLGPVPSTDVDMTSGPTTSNTSLDSPSLLHLSHVHALKGLHNALGHVKRFRAYLGAQSAKAENAQIAKDVLVDLVDYSGVDISALHGALGQVLEMKSLIEADPVEARRSLVMCQPTPAMGAHLRAALEKVTVSPVINKPRLFVKPSDLVDGVAAMTLDSPKGGDRDVVTHALLTNRGPALVCVRCAGKSQIGSDVSIAGHISLRWRTWERIWTTRCVCGGLWTSP